MIDHRRLGRELELFDTDPLMGAGLPYWLPDGAAVRHTLEEYVRDLERRAGYRHVYSPVLGKRELYELSGHWAHYRDDMFPPMNLGSEQVLLRPSLCPHHALVYRSRSHSHRELPLRIAELGGMFRSEPSGVLGGLTRVRAIQLNDAHVFCTPEQVADEASAALTLIRRAHAALGIEASRYRLSLPGPGGKYVDDPQMWHRSVAVLTEVLDASGLPYDAIAGEAAFYGRRSTSRSPTPPVASRRCPPCRSTSISRNSSGCTTSARRRQTPAGDDPPQHHRQPRTRRRASRRSARRRVPRVARAHPAGGAARHRRRGGRRGAAGGPLQRPRAAGPRGRSR
ncbi:hypothetical protein P9209_02715 [Prescottella defluvii]|nr:hypothetical protein P9209_02715 [Prescottella defluvii]